MNRFHAFAYQERAEMAEHARWASRRLTCPCQTGPGNCRLMLPVRGKRTERAIRAGAYTGDEKGG
jgi:hypothetical protein